MTKPGRPLPPLTATVPLATLPLATLLLATLLSAPPAEAQTGRSEGGVTYGALVAAKEQPGNWLMYSGQYNGQRFSRLDQINKGNASTLQLEWVRQIATLSAVETTPLVVDGVMYATSPDNEVLALDARTGNPYWSYRYPVPEQLSLCCGKQSRGVAILGDRLFLGTLDGHLIALDAKTGDLLWDTPVAKASAGYSITAAPLVVKDMVLTGIGGGEYGIRGFIDAYDAATGELRWRTYTIPGEGEPGNETWEGDSWKTGGAPTWMTGSFDPELDLIYWGTGNPGPDWNGEDREGDNLYSDSALALDADTGEIRWHFQFTPHDVHDWDACQIPVLVDAEIGGRARKLMLWANRNGFFYALDRATGEFLRATEMAKQTWAKGITEDGRPIRIPGMLPTKEGTLVYPSVDGAANWWSPSYSPRTGLFYAMTYDGADTFYLTDTEYREGQLFVGGYGRRPAPQDNYVSAVRAIDPLTGDRKWEYRVQPKSTSGLLATAGDVVFGGTVTGGFYALDATNGEELWHTRLGARIHAAPMSYLVDGQQRVTIAAGHALFTFGLRSEG